MRHPVRQQHATFGLLLSTVGVFAAATLWLLAFAMLVHAQSEAGAGEALEAPETLATLRIEREAPAEEGRGETRSDPGVHDHSAAESLGPTRGLRGSTLAIGIVEGTASVITEGADSRALNEIGSIDSDMDVGGNATAIGVVKGDASAVATGQGSRAVNKVGVIGD